MERLTVMTDKGAALVMGGPYESEQAVRADLMERYKVAVARLAAYEDTGLTPEEVKTLNYKLLGVMHAVDKWLDGQELEQDEVNRAATMREKTLQIVEGLQKRVKHFEELVQAERDGRLVVLPPPAKEGDPAPKCFYNEADNPWAWCLGMGKGPGDDEPSERCKACWYLETAHQEAEAAQKEGQN